MVKKHIIKDFDLEKVSWDKIKSPSPIFKLFIPTDEKLKSIVHRLMNDYLYLQDEDRDYDIIWKQIFYLFPIDGVPKAFHIIYEIGEFDGFISFNDISIGHKCLMSLKLWNPRRFNSHFMREGKALINLIMNEFKLNRISTESPDERMVKMSKIVGLKVEGAQKHAFLWDGDFYTKWIMAITR